MSGLSQWDTLGYELTFSPQIPWCQLLFPETSDFNVSTSVLISKVSGFVGCQRDGTKGRSPGLKKKTEAANPDSLLFGSAMIFRRHYWIWGTSSCVGVECIFVYTGEKWRPRSCVTWCFAHQLDTAPTALNLEKVEYLFSIKLKVIFGKQESTHWPQYLVYSFWIDYGSWAWLFFGHISSTASRADTASESLPAAGLCWCCHPHGFCGPLQHLEIISGPLLTACLFTGTQGRLWRLVVGLLLHTASGQEEATPQCKKPLGLLEPLWLQISSVIPL